MKPRVTIPLVLVLLALWVFMWMGDGKWIAPENGSLPELPMRVSGRMCCVFGVDLQAKFLEIPLPFLNVSRVDDIENVGPHRYDSAWGALDDERGGAFPFGEDNAYVYTCRGGFIDVAHLREQADWTSLFISRLHPILETGGTIELPDEGSHRQLVARPVSRDLIERVGRDELLVALSQWAAYQVSVWHEFIQWYSVSLLEQFPETASAFSPDDPYTNAVGTRMMDGFDFRAALVSEKVYNRHLDALIAGSLEAYEPAPRELGDRLMRALDQYWWDGNERLPERGVTMRRLLDVDHEVAPWLFPASRGTSQLLADLEAACGAAPRPLPVRVVDEVGGIPIRELLSYQITMNGRLDPEPDFADVLHGFDQQFFPLLIERIREDNRRRFGPRADRPD